MSTFEHAYNLVGRYCDAVLRVDVDGFAGTWTSDATWSIPGEGTISGRAEIARTFARIRGEYPLCVQEILNGQVHDIDGRQVRVEWQVRESQWRPDGTRSELIGVYHDELRLESDTTWRFASRAFELVAQNTTDGTARVRLGPHP